MLICFWGGGFERVSVSIRFLQMILCIQLMKDKNPTIEVKAMCFEIDIDSEIE
jgi:hypothetical protein